MSLSMQQTRERRKKRIRKKVSGTTERPRLTVFRSLKHIYAQVVDDVRSVTLASASSAVDKFPESGGRIKGAELVGKMVAEKAMGAGIKSVVFDRNGYIYHGRIKALAEGARAQGLNF